MNVKEALKNASNSISLPDAEILLSFVLGIEKIKLVSYPEKKLSLFQKIRFLYLVRKRKNNFPVAYLTGQKFFYGLEFVVNKNTLVPRPETELMVELALENLNDNSKSILIDLGTGTGCIPISILKNIKVRDLESYAVDVSRKALKVAKRNARRHSAQLKILKGSLLTPLKNLFKETSKKFVITANLPYLTQEQIDNELSIEKEPHLALYADDGGLHLYKETLKQLKEYNPKNFVIFMEIDPTQKSQLEEFSKKVFADSNVKTHNDLFGRARVVEVSI